MKLKKAIALMLSGFFLLSTQKLYGSSVGAYVPKSSANQTIRWDSTANGGIGGFVATNAILTDGTHVTIGSPLNTGYALYINGTVRSSGTISTSNAITGMAILSAISTKISNYTLVYLDSIILANGTLTLTLPSASISGAGHQYVVKNVGTGIVIIAGTIDGTTNLILNPGDTAIIATDGTSYYQIGKTSSASANGGSVNVATVTASSYSVVANVDRFLAANAVSNNVVFLLPDPTNYSGPQIDLTRFDASGTYTVTIATAGTGKSITGYTSVVSQYQVRHAVRLADGSGWFIF